VTRPIRLRVVGPQDHETLVALRRDVDLQHRLLANPPTGGDTDVSGWVARREHGGALWCIADAATDQCLGYVQLANIHRKNRHGWLGIALAEDARGGGVGRTAMEALAEEARALGLRKLLLEVRVDNNQAIALYKRIGYARVGILRDQYDDGERFHDTLIMEHLLYDSAE
jgi:RimJ/RimL family protein N-acetyltransferase